SPRPPGDAPLDLELGHIHQRVADLAEAEQFYSDFLGLAVTQRTYPGALFFGAGGYHHHIGANVWGGTGAISIRDGARVSGLQRRRNCDGANISLGGRCGWDSRAPGNSVGLVSYRLEVPIAEILYCLRHRAPLLGYETRMEPGNGGNPILQIRDPNENW